MPPQKNEWPVESDTSTVRTYDKKKIRGSSLGQWFILFFLTAAAAFLSGYLTCSMDSSKHLDVAPLNQGTQISFFDELRIQHIQATEGPPPEIVHDIKGRSISLPFASTQSDSAKCLRSWQAMKTMVPQLISGNNQRPYSTNNEDALVLEHILAMHEPANTAEDSLEDAAASVLWSSSTRTFHFLEIGGFDGITESNTLLFERCLNWRGMLVEANPVAWEALKIAGRTHSHLVHASPSCNLTSLPLSSNLLRGESFTPMVKMEGHSYTSSAITTGDAPKGLDVPCVPLTAILASVGMGRIDFFSLDVEGSEELVLSTLDFQAIDVPLMLVESENRQCGAVCPKRDRIRARAQMMGYVVDTVTVRKSDMIYRK